MALQTTVTQFQQPGARGLIANAEARNIISRSLVASAVAALMFGDPVYRVVTGTGDDQCSADPAAGEFLGLARRNSSLDPANAVADSYAVNDEVPAMEVGVMWVLTAKAVTAGAAANFNTATRLWTDAAVAGTIIDVPNCEFDSTNTAAGLAKVRVKKAVA